MKIVYYTDQVYLHGGIEKVIAQKLNYLVSVANYEVYLITFEQKEKSFCYPISKKVIHYDLAINYYTSVSFFNQKNFRKIPRHVRSLKAKLNDIKPDVLIVCNYGFDFYFIPFIGNNIKIIKEFHSSRYYYIKKLTNSSFYTKWLYKINNFIEKKYSHIVILNWDEKKYYKSNNIEVIPNSIAIKKNIANNERKKIIIAAGRIAVVKQFDHLIQSWSLIGDKYPDWEIHIYGEGDELLLLELKTLIIKLSVPNICLKGATTSLKNKMEEASIYALTSKTECFPMVLLEALSFGLPIIAYDCPHGPKNIIIDAEDGILVENNNIDDFAKRLSNLIENKVLREKMSINARLNVVRFDEKLIMNQWLNLFNKI